MADANDWKVGDHEPVILRKILTRLGGVISVTDVGGGGGGGGSLMVTIADGADVTQGAKADAAVTNPAASASEIALLKGLLTVMATLTNVGGFSQSIKDTTAISASPDYSIGDAVGAKRTLLNAVRTPGTAILEDIVILDRANQKPGLEIIIFDADPTAATITDNAAFVFSTDDLKVVARVTVNTSDYITINSKAIAHIPNLGRLVKAASGTTLYAAIVATTAYNAAAVDDLQVIYKFLQD